MPSVVVSIFDDQSFGGRRMFDLGGGTLRSPVADIAPDARNDESYRSRQ
jgi:hypothetical protein